MIPQPLWVCTGPWRIRQEKTPLERGFFFYSGFQLDGYPIDIGPDLSL